MEQSNAATPVNFKLFPWHLQQTRHKRYRSLAKFCSQQHNCKLCPQWHGRHKTAYSRFQI